MTNSISTARHRSVSKVHKWFDDYFILNYLQIGVQQKNDSACYADSLRLALETNLQEKVGKNHYFPEARAQNDLVKCLVLSEQVQKAW